MRIIDRYLMHEIVKPLLVISTLLLSIFVSYIAAEFLADAASGLLPANPEIQRIGALQACLTFHRLTRRSTSRLVLLHSAH